MKTQQIEDGRGSPPQPTGEICHQIGAAALAARQAQRAALIERAEQRRRRRLGPLTVPGLRAATVLPFPLPAVRDEAAKSEAPLRCQWLFGEGPFSDADKCGAPVAAGQSYCAHHRARAALVEGEAAAADSNAERGRG